MRQFKRFMVWRSEQYYPGGGLEDFEESFDTLDEAKSWIESDKAENRGYNPWYGIFDRIEGVEIELGNPEKGGEL